MITIKTRLVFTLYRAAFVLSHGLLCAATFVKRNVARGRAVVVRLVVHEGAWTFVILCGMYRSFYNLEKIESRY